MRFFNETVRFQVFFKRIDIQILRAYRRREILNAINGIFFQNVFIVLVLANLLNIWLPIATYLCIKINHVK